MPIETECPLCGHRGRVPDKFDGKQVKCPQCCNLFVASAAGTAGIEVLKESPASGSQAGQMKGPTAGSVHGGQKVVKPGASSQGAAKPAGGSQYGQMKLTPTSGSAQGTQKVVKPGLSSQGTQKAGTAGSAHGTPKVLKPGGSAHGTQKIKPTGKSSPGTQKKKKAAADPFASFNYDAPTKGGGTPTYKKKKRRRKLVNVLFFMFMIGGCTILGAGGLKYHSQLRGAYDQLAQGKKIQDVWANLEFKPKPPPPDEDPDVNPEGKKDPAETKVDPAPKVEAPGELLVDVTKGPARVGSVQVKVMQISIETPPGVESKDKLFLVKLQLKNEGKERVDFQGWGTLEPINDKLEPVLIDKDNDKSYKRVTFGPGVLAEGQVLAKSIDPGQMATDLLAFEVPAAGTAAIQLELSAENFAEKGKFGFLIPGTLLAKAGIPSKAPEPEIKPVMKPEPEEEVAPPRVLATIRPQLKAAAAARKEAIETLGELGAGAASATPDLVAVLQKDKDETIRAMAAAAIGKIGPKAATAIPALIEVLKKDDFWKVRAECATALGNMGPEAKDLGLPALKEALKDKDEMVVAAVKAAIKRLEPKADDKMDKKD